MKSSINKKSFLAIIPARGGSKRIPNKNILNLHNKPLISYTIEAALNCKYINEIVVSSDSKNILEIANEYNITALQRASNLATDTSSTEDTVIDILHNISNSYDYIILLQPTSPLRTENHIKEAIEQLIKKDAECIVSMCELDHPIEWTTKLDADLTLDSFIQTLEVKRSQDCETHYRLNGALYIIKTSEFLKEKSFFSKNNSVAYIMNREDSIDIDERIDFLLAEKILESR